MTTQIREQLLSTIELTVASMVLATIFGILLGVASAVWQQAPHGA